MEDKQKKEGISLFSRSKNCVESDPLEEIFALNLGDFLTEHLISEDFAHKIKNTVHDKTEGLKKQLRELNSIYSLDKTLSLLGLNDKDDYIIYNSIAKTIVKMIETDACHIFLLNEYTKGLENTKNDLVLVGTSIESDEDLYSHKIGYNLKVGEIISQSFTNHELMFVKNVQSRNDFLPVYKLKEENAVDYISVPMYNNIETVGIIILENYETKDMPDAYIELIKITAQLFATSMYIQKLTEETSLSLNDENAPTYELQRLRAELTAAIGDLGEQQQIFVENLAQAVDSKGQYEVNHSQKVADLSRDICKFIGLNEKTTDLIYYAGLLQNIGKITLPKKLFTKKDKLTAEEWKTLQDHPNLGVSLLMSINFLSEVIPYINYNKERWDGHGTPEGLKGNSIPLGSRIIAVADAYCAMTTDRSYRKAMDTKKALEILKEEAGIKWDPIIVDAVFQLKQQG